jgi:very-short-patch-repair endonuclease
LHANLGIILLVLFAVAVLAAALLKRNVSAAPAGRWPLYAKRVLGEREQVLYWRLVAALPDHIVLCQVALSQLLAIEKHTANRQALGNRFRQLCADFVICKRSFDPVAVIELDGLSHDHPRRAAADARKTHAVESAGLLLLRINAAQIPAEGEIRAQLAEVIASRGRTQRSTHAEHG